MSEITPVSKKKKEEVTSIEKLKEYLGKLDSNPREVSLVLFHAQIFWLAGAIQDTNLSPKKFDGLKMWWIPNDGLVLERRGAYYTVPSANVIGMEHP